MTKTLEFTVQGVPVPQGSMKSFAIKAKTGKHRAVTTANNHSDLVAWRNKVAAVALVEASRQGWEKGYDGPVTLEVLFFFTPPKKPRFKAMAVRPDLDKLVRAIGDSLSPSSGPKIISEDSRIWAIRATKNYTHNQPHAVILLTKEDQQ